MKWCFYWLAQHAKGSQWHRHAKLLLCSSDTQLYTCIRRSIAPGSHAASHTHTVLLEVSQRSVRGAFPLTRSPRISMPSPHHSDLLRSLRCFPRQWAGCHGAEFGQHTARSPPVTGSVVEGCSVSPSLKGGPRLCLPLAAPGLPAAAATTRTR